MMQVLKFCLPNSYTTTIPNLSPSARLFTYPSETRKCNNFVHSPSSSVGFYRLKSSSVLHRNCLKYTALRVHSEMAHHDDGFYMRRSVELARKAIGHTSPNPMVGCVIVKDGNIVGEGFHPKAGQPHAEVFALRDAGELAENATAYVSLEPCNHYGRTPPCTEALLKAKVKKVVVGMVDPNPIVASKGLEKLKAAGVEVTVGVEEELCKNLLEAYTHRMLTGKPFVTLRYSMSINGHVLDQLGEGASTSGGYYSKLMQEYDAVIISSTSLNQKSSLPVSEEPEANQPLRIIVSRKSDFQFEAPEDKSKTIFFSDKEHARATGSADNGIETVLLDQLNMSDILDHCYKQGMCSVLLDLRGNLDDYEDLLKEKDLVQKVIVELLPVWDESGIAARSLTSLVKGVSRVQNMTARSFDQSIVLESRILN